MFPPGEMTFAASSWQALFSFLDRPVQKEDQPIDLFFLDRERRSD